MTPFKVALALSVGALYLSPEPVRGEAFEPTVIFAPAPKSNTGDNSLIRQAYAERCLAEHLEQRRSGLLEDLGKGRACWYCKERGHVWEACAMNPRVAGRVVDFCFDRAGK